MRDKILTPAAIITTALILIINLAYTTVHAAMFANGGYDITVEIDPGMEQDCGLLLRIGYELMAGSIEMHAATKHQALIKKVTVYVPDHWECDGVVEEGTGHSMTDIYVSDQSDCSACASMEGEGGSIFYSPDRLGVGSSAFLHEWGHYRWGLGDEYCRYVNRGYDRYQDYFDEGTQEWYHCAEASTPVPSTCREARLPDQCAANVQSVYPDADSTEGLAASVMDSHWLFSEFCMDDPEETGTGVWRNEDLYRYHNSEQNSHHNSRYDGSSTWTVIEDHPDGLVHEGGRTVDWQNFEIIYKKHGNYNIALAIDVSGSMGEHGRYMSAYSAANSLIALAEEGVIISITAFNEGAIHMLAPTRITDDSSRVGIASFLPVGPLPDTWTSIGAGVLSALEMIDCSGSRSRQFIVVLTDGRENRPPSLMAVAEQAAGCAQVIVMGLALHEMPGLRNLAEVTGGTFFSAPDGDHERMASDVLTHLANATRRVPAQLLFSEGRLVSSGVAAQTFEVEIDPTLGEDTVFSFLTRSPPDIEASLVSPGGTIWDSASPGYEIDLLRGEIRFKIPGTAESGTWQIRFAHNGEEGEADIAAVVARVISSPKRAEHTAGLKVILKPTAVNFPEPVRITASLYEGPNAIVGAHVYAKVRHPDPGPYESTVILQDHGQGADTFPGDGIYSGHFTGFSGEGSYFVEVFAEGLEGRTSRGSFFGERMGGEDGGDGLKSVSAKSNSNLLGFKFQRKISAGTFDVSGFVPSGNPMNPFEPKDLIAPSKITSLYVDRLGKTSLRLGWMSVGDDLDNGRAAGYDIRYAKEPIRTDEIFNSAAAVQGLSAPKESGQPEEVVIRNLEYNTKYYFAMKVIDDAGNTSPRSNVVTSDLTRSTGFPEIDGLTEGNPDPDPAGVGDDTNNTSGVKKPGGCSCALIHEWEKGRLQTSKRR